MPIVAAKLYDRFIILCKKSFCKQFYANAAIYSFAVLERSNAPAAPTSAQTTISSKKKMLT